MDLDAFSRDLTRHPERFARPSSSDASSILSSLVHLYRLAKSSEHVVTIPDPLADLYTDGFDHHQIWEQIQMRNDRVTETANSLLDRLQTDDNNHNNDDDDESGNDNSDDGMEELVESDDNVVIENSHESVDDEEDDGDDFDMDQLLSDENVGEDMQSDDDQHQNGNGNMEQDEDEDDEDDDDDEELDLFQDLGSEDEEAAQLKYSDFFAPPAQAGKRHNRRVQFDLPGDVDEEEDFDEHLQEIDGNEQENNDEEPEDDSRPMDLFGNEEDVDETKLSTFEKQQRKLQQQVAELEQENLNRRDWQLQGEISGKERPVNSLLEEDLDFEHASRPAPIITEELTSSIEDLIKKRIADHLFDDVERRLAPSDYEQTKSRVQMDLSDEKPQKSLADEYESEFIAQKEAMDAAVNGTVKADPLEPKRQEIKSMMEKLFSKLDTLSNWHFTPTPAKLELSVMEASSGVPAIEVEETTPTFVSDATLLAPHEIEPAKRSETDLKTSEELSKQEKDRLRKRAKKQKKAENEEKAKRQKTLEATKGTKILSKTAALDELKGKRGVSVVQKDGSLEDQSNKRRK